MSEPSVEVQDALRQTGASWDANRTERTLPQAHARRASRRRRAQAGAAVALLAVLGAGFAALRASDRAASVAVSPARGDERTLHFEDGSQARLLDAQARVVVSEVSRSSIAVSLTAGRARFNVAPRKERRFRVVCGEVVVQVLGTSFELTREGARTRVQVRRGRVEVRWPGGIAELGTGESGWFGGVARAQAGAPASATRAAATPPTLDPERRGAQDRSWKQQAEQGDFRGAYALLEAERGEVADDVEELLLAADAARLSGHAAQALPFLQKVVDRHAGDPRAPLAAFTLGGVLMNQLGRPHEAEAAYARARALSPEGSMAQDALARQVEAAHRAGDASRAQALALDYLERHPDGRRVQAVRRFGGVP